MKPAQQFVRLTATLILGLAGADLQAQAGPPQTNAPALPTSMEYKLRPLDRIAFSIEEDPFNTGQPEPLAVSALGEVQVPVSRGYAEMISVPARGKTLGEFQSDVKAELEKGYYRQATVHMRLVRQGRRLNNPPGRPPLGDYWLPGEFEKLRKGRELQRREMVND